MKTLRVRLPPLAEFGADSTLDFELLDRTRTVLERGQAVPAALPRAARTELVVAATDVLLVETVLPPLSGGRLRAALPSIAEPHVVSDIEGSWVVAAARPDGGRHATLAVLDRGLFMRALELLRRAKIEAAAATPEQLALPLAEGRWRLRLHPAYAALRTSRLSGIACSAATHDKPPVELELALRQAGEARPAALEVEGACDTEAWSRVLGLPVEQAGAAEPGAPPVALELLQYELGPRLVAWQTWRVPLALAALVILTWITGLNIEAALMRGEERALRAHAERTLRDAFPSIPVVLDPLRQMQRGVADLRAGGGGAADPREFLPLATAVAGALQQDGEAVRALDFRDGALRIEFDPKMDPRSRDRVMKSVQTAGVSARWSESTLNVRAKGETP
jgi:general secretion pathway protein L